MTGRSGGVKACNSAATHAPGDDSLLRMTPSSLVPDDVAVPTELIARTSCLEPLGPQHNASDHTAWSSSVEHIPCRPGLRGRERPPRTE